MKVPEMHFGLFGVGGCIISTEIAAGCPAVGCDADDAWCGRGHRQKIAATIGCGGGHMLGEVPMSSLLAKL